MAYYKTKEEWKEHVEVEKISVEDLYPTKKEQLEAFREWDREEKIKAFAELSQKEPTLSQRALYRKAKAGGFSIRQERMAKVVKEERTVGLYWSYEVHTTIQKTTKVKKNGRIVKKITTKRDVRYISDGIRRNEKEIRIYLNKVVYVYVWDLVSIDHIYERYQPYISFEKRIEELMRA